MLLFLRVILVVLMFGPSALEEDRAVSSLIDQTFEQQNQKERSSMARVEMALDCHCTLGEVLVALESRLYRELTKI